MGPPSFMRSAVDRNVVMWFIPVYALDDVFLNKPTHRSVWGKKNLVHK